MRAEVIFKEVGRDREGKTSYIGENLTRDFIIDFFGLNNDDVESYSINIYND